MKDNFFERTTGFIPQDLQPVEPEAQVDAEVPLADEIDLTLTPKRTVPLVTRDQQSQEKPYARKSPSY